MSFKVLYTRPDKPDLPQCQAIRKTPYANDSSHTDFQCKWSALYEVNGKLLCSKHAGMELLKQSVESSNDKNK